MTDFRQLDFLTSPKGAESFSIVITAIQNERAKTESPLDIEGVDDLVDRFVESHSITPDQNALLKGCVKAFILIQPIASSLLGQSFSMSGSMFDDPDATIPVGSLLFAAANSLHVLDTGIVPNLALPSKRDFIRLAVFMYDMASINSRNGRILRGDSPTQFQ